MLRSATFWGSILILCGVLLLLDASGVIQFEIWEIILPLLLVALGIWILWGALTRRSNVVEHQEIPLAGAGAARIRIQHAAGRLNVHSGASEGKLVVGDFAGGVKLTTSQSDDEQKITLSIPGGRLPWVGWGPGDSLDWSIALAQEIPLTLILETGAGETRLDLEKLLVRKLRLNSGASSTRLTLPANAGFTQAEFKTGAASLDLRIPDGVAARIRASGGLATINIDKRRFPAKGGNYQSDDYESAPNKLDIQIESGVGSVEVH